MGFQLRGGLSPTSSVTPDSSSLVYIDPSSCSFTLIDEFCQGTGERLQYCYKDSGSVMRDTFSPPQENCLKKNWILFNFLCKRRYLTACPSTCRLLLHCPGEQWDKFFCISNTWILTSTLSILQCKNTLIPLLQIWKLPFTLESKTCSKDFIFAQFNLFREFTIYDLSWAVHSDKYWSPSCN